MMAHVTPGEMMIPPEMMARHPDLQKKLYQAYAEEGFDPRQFKVGSGITSLNPVTGKPEYGFFKKLFKIAAPVVGYAMGGAMGAAIGGALAGASDGGGWKGGLKGAAIGYVGGSLAAGGAFGSTIASNAGMGFGGAAGTKGLGGYGTKWAGSGNTWGPDKAKGWLDGGTLGDKAGSNQMMAISALGALTTEPAELGAAHVPNDDPGEPFDIDSPTPGTDGYKGHEITDASAGYETGYKDHKAVNMPYASTAYVESPLIKPADLVIGNPNITAEELMEYYKPVAYKSHGGMIKHGTTGTADDVPIMASKGEVVMTADAVRNAGQGDPRMGAKKLYDLMYSLEGVR
jgi:hypothetical protein